MAPDDSSWRDGLVVEFTRKRALVADAHRCVRDLVEMALKIEGSCQVVGHASLGSAVLEKCRVERPEILILDPRLPDVAGPEIVRRVREEHCEVRVLVFSGVSNPELMRDVLGAQPHGFVHKEEPLGVFYEVLRAVVRGSRCYSEYGSRLLETSAAGGGRSPKMVLAPREKDVLTLLAHGLSSKQIAHEMKLAPKTIDHYRTALMSKLDIHEVAGLTRYAVSMGMVNVDR